MPGPLDVQTPSDSAEARAESGADRCDLVLGLERPHPEALVAREVVEDVRGRRDRVGAQKQRQLRLDAGRDQAEPEGLVAGDVPVGAGRHLRRRHLVLRREALGGLAERVPGLERARVGLCDLRPLGELLLDVGDRALGRARVEPGHQPEREHVLRALRLATRDADALERLLRQRRQRHSLDEVLVDRAVVQRIRRIARLLQVPIGERVGVDDQRSARCQVVQVRPQSGGVHGDEHVRGVAGREDVVVGEVDLEAGHARQRARRRADLGREVGQRREIVAHEGRLAREAPSGELHAVTGVPCETDDHALELLDGLGHLPPQRYSTTPLRTEVLARARSRGTDDRHAPHCASASRAFRSRGSLTIARLPSGSVFQSSRGRSRYSSIPFPSGSWR